MFSFFKRKPKDTPTDTETAPPATAPATAPAPAAPAAPALAPQAIPEPAAVAPQAVVVPVETPAETRQSWMKRLKAGLSKTSTNLTTLFVGARIDDELYEELEAALLMADAGVEATQFLLNGLKRRVKEQKLTDAAQVKTALRALMVELLTPLQKPLVLGREQPLVLMIACEKSHSLACP